MDYKTAYQVTAHGVQKTGLKETALTAQHLDVGKKELVAADGFRLVIARIDDVPKYPDYTQLIPKEFVVELELDIEQLYLNARLYNANKSSIVRMHLEERVLVFTQENLGVRSFMTYTIVSDKRQTKNPKQVRIAINSEYLLQCVNAMKQYCGIKVYQEELRKQEAGYSCKIRRGKMAEPLSTTCKLSITNSDKPMMFSVGDYTEVIMPMFVQW